MDPYDLLDPVDIMPKLPKDLDEQLNSKKWQERKAALDVLHGVLMENPRLADSPDYRQLIEQLTKMLGSDANINCASQAAKSLTGFAKGLRNKFGPCTASLAPVIFDKFKEKKATLREPLVELIDAVFACSNLTNLAQSILEAAKKPNPSQKTQLDLFLYRIFRSMELKDIPKGMLKDLVAVLSEHAFDPDAEVRDSSCAALGAIQKCIGDKALGLFLGNNVTADPMKMAKISEYREKAESESAAIRAEIESLKADHANQQMTNQPATPATNHQSHAQQATANPQPQQFDAWELLDPVDIMPKLPKDLDEQLNSKKWQERKAALDLVHGVLSENPKLADSPDYRQLIEQLTKMLSSDANINCASQAAKSLTGFARGLRTKFGTHAQTVAPTVLEKFKEKKAILRDPLIDLIDAVYANTNLTNLAPTIMEAAKRPNPSQKAQLDQFLYRVFRSMEPKDIPKGLLKDLVAVLSEHAFDPDAEVRDSSCAALGAIQKCIGEKALGLFLGNNVTADPMKMAKIAEYNEKAESEAPKPKIEPQKPVGTPAQQQPTSSSQSTAVSAGKPPIPSGKKLQQEQEENGSQNAEASNDIPQTSNPSANTTAPPATPNNNAQNGQQILTPKVEPVNPLDPVDIMPKLPGILQKQLGSKKWEERQAALDALASILAQHERLVDNPDYRALIEDLTLILSTEQNIPRATLTIQCLIGFAKGLGKKFVQHAATVAPVVFEKFKEKKAVLQEPLVELIDAVFAGSNLNILQQSILEAANKPSPNQKAQLDQFLYRVFRTLDPKEIPKGMLKDVVTFLSQHVFDSDPGVRDSAFAALGAILKCVGEKSVLTYLNSKVTGDALKMAKIAEYREKVISDAPLAMPKYGSTPSGNQMSRARSASGTRRSMVPSMTANESIAMGGADDSTVSRPARRTHAGTGMSSAQSHASALNATFTAGGQFQLDPKFFENDFDGDTTLAQDATTTMHTNGTGVNQKAALNMTFNKDGKGGPAERGVLGRNTMNTTATFEQQQDLQPIKPVVRPTTTFSRRSESVSSISSLESAEHIDRAVHNVSSLQLNIAEEAIAQLLHLLNDPSNRQYVIDRAELTLREIITQIFHIRSQHFEQLEAAKEASTTGGVHNAKSGVKEAELSEFMRSICNFLSSLTKEPNMMQKISSDTLRAFVDAILSLVTDQRLRGLNDQIFRSLNIVVIRLCDSTNPNSCFVALMKLIIKYQAQQPNGKMMDCVRKCMIKHTEILADPNKVEQIDIPTVLEPIHTYYSRFYVVNDQQKHDESVKQTSKVLYVYMQRVIVHKRYSILNYLYQFPENSHMVEYIKRCVRAIGGKRSAETADGKPHMPEDLERFFARVDDDIFCGAVEDLYNFMDIHPEQNGNFEQLMGQCEYAPIIRKAFIEIRQCRSRKELLHPGICVRRVLPEETRTFLDNCNQLITRIDELTKQHNGTAGASPTLAGGSQKSTPT